jgi:predicted site-specific integrase-resolvase
MEVTKMSDRPLTAKELAERLGEKIFTIQRWGRAKVIPVIDLGHRTKRFDFESVKAALLRRQLKAVTTRAKR